MAESVRRGRYRGKRVSVHRPRPAPRRPAGRGGSGVVSDGQRRRTVQLVVAGGIFVLLVMWKLLSPESLAAVADTVRNALGQDADFKAAFSAVGRAIAGDEGVGESLQEAYTAVFAPGRYHAAQASATIAAAEQLTPTANRLWEELAPYLSRREAHEPAEGAEGERQPADSQSLVFFSAAAPANVSFGQAVMGFSYTTPAQGTVTDTFGYRDHPIYHEERFHYGLDIANTAGTDIHAFADGTVKAIGESDALGLYVMLTHPNDVTTIYAHCSAVEVSTGQAVKMGDTIAQMGATGLATGSHLHFEVLKGDTYLNPIYYVAVY